mmetsp:Transcript_42469/g.96686  ORF Transcript_42469/g.96686 Transcript_42469/m.96686 type:complete len:210 (-) Transcript_42469:708-1337(-)
MARETRRVFSTRESTPRDLRPQPFRFFGGRSVPSGAGAADHHRGGCRGLGHGSREAQGLCSRGAVWDARQSLPQLVPRIRRHTDLLRNVLENWGDGDAVSNRQVRVHGSSALPRLGPPGRLFAVPRPRRRAFHGRLPGPSAREAPYPPRVPGDGGRAPAGQVIDGALLRVPQHRLALHPGHRNLPPQGLHSDVTRASVPARGRHSPRPA